MRSVVRKAVMAMTIDDTFDMPCIHGLSVDMVYDYINQNTQNHVPKSEVEHALQEMLARELKTSPVQACVDEYGEEVIHKLRQTMTEQEIHHPLRQSSDFQIIPWDQYSYSKLQAVERVLYHYGTDSVFH